MQDGDMISVIPDLFCCHRLLVSEEDLSHWQEQLKIAQEVVNTVAEANAYCCLTSYGLARRGERKATALFDCVITQYRLGLMIAAKEDKEEADLDQWRTWGYFGLGDCYQNVGQFDKAIENFALGLSIAKDVVNRSTQVRAFCGLGECYRSSGHADQAIENYEQGLSVAKRPLNTTSRACRS
jgi:tetratricopeptide (TPR) repeat protein